MRGADRGNYRIKACELKNNFIPGTKMNSVFYDKLIFIGGNDVI